MIIYWLEHFLTTKTASKSTRPSLFCAVLFLGNYGHQPNICKEIYIMKATSQLAIQCTRTTNFDKCINLPFAVGINQFPKRRSATHLSFSLSISQSIMIS